MNTVIPRRTTTIPAAGAPTTKPAPTTVDKPSAPPEAECDTFTPSPLNHLQFMLRNVLYGTLPVNPPTPSPCPSN